MCCSLTRSSECNEVPVHSLFARVANRDIPTLFSYLLLDARCALLVLILGTTGESTLVSPSTLVFSLNFDNAVWGTIACRAYLFLITVLLPEMRL